MTADRTGAPTEVAPELEALLPGLVEWLPGQRWFAAKGRTVTTVRIVGHQEVTPADAVPAVAHVVIAVEFADGGPEDWFQLLLGSRPGLKGDLEHAVIGSVGGRTVYDGLADGEISRLLLSLVVSDTTVGSLRFVPEPGVEAPIIGPGRPLLGEQSNSSVVYGERAILKLFRRATAGLNPDLELHRALGREHSTEVAPLLGAIEGELKVEHTDRGAGRTVPMTVAMLQDYASNSADGWSMALTSVRDLLAEGDLRPDEVGGDFAGEATRLGKTVAAVHTELARALGTTVLDGEGVRAVADWMLARLDQAADAVPEVAARRDAIAAVLEGVNSAASTGLVVQRIHGDLHLGQELRTPRGWLVIDFEGEPSRPLTDRVRPDSPLRDVAAMLRSFDYAAFHQLAEWEPGTGDTSSPPSHLQRRAQEWADRNRSAFCDGYAAIAGADPRADLAVLRAYELDKAVYEVLYETRNRPNWLAIPLRSMERLLTSP
jgi:maltokinase